MTISTTPPRLEVWQVVDARQQILCRGRCDVVDEHDETIGDGVDIERPLGIFRTRWLLAGDVWRDHRSAAGALDEPLGVARIDDDTRVVRADDRRRKVR